MTSFVSSFFDNKPLRQLKSTITKGWTDKHLRNHMKMLSVPQSATSVLEVGCGIGRMLKSIIQMPNVEVCYGYDASKCMIEEAPKYCPNPKVQFRLCDGTGAIKHPDPLVDFSFSWLVFQHIPSSPTVLRYVSNMARVTASGGTVKCQLLRHNERPGSPLWSWHSPTEIAITMEKAGCDSTVDYFTDRWVMVKGIKR
jgi:ubiquinone/menaquinone biosynthesis C-methylase UbiE